MRTVFRADHVVIGDGRTIEGGFVAVEDDKIASVGRAIDAPPGDRTVELSGCTLLPGLIDVHVHLIGGDKTIGFDEDASVMRRDIEATTGALLEGVSAARATLNAGFTTVREVGGRDYLDVALRDAQRSGLVVGPRMLASGPGIWPTGGLGCQTEPCVGVDSPGGAIRRVRQLVARGVDVIKIVGADGPEWLDAGTMVFPTFSEIEAAFAEATRTGRLKAAHAMCHDAIEAVIRAGTDTVEHAWYLTEENCASLIDSGTYLVGTLSNVWAMVHRGPAIAFPWAETMAREEEAIMNRYKMAIDKGVKVVVGTDVGGNPAHQYGDNARELAAYVRCGMSPLEAISSATLEAARAIRLDHSVGSIEPGKVADLIVVSGDPLTDVEVIRTGVVAVLQAGVARRDDLGLLTSLQ